MKNLIESSVARRTNSVAGILACALTAIAAMPAIAAPGDTQSPPRAQESNLIDQPAGSLYAYQSVAGSTFHPLDSNTSYSYPGNGCIAKTGGAESRFVHRIVLPQGAVVRFLRLYYYDTSASDLSAFFTTYDGAGNYSEVTTVSSGSGPTGFATTLSPALNFTVDRYTSAINVLVNLSNQNNETLRFCGVRIAYEAPLTDLIFANGFEPIPL